MLAAGGPGAEDDDLGGDDDGANASSLAGSLAGGCWDVRDAPGPRDAGSQDADGQDCGPAGFGSGQPLDVLRPGPVLAGEADRAHTGALRAVSDDELTGMIKAWRRLSSWATARELSAIAEFARRRPEEDTESDFARHARARRAASGPPQAATQASSAQTAQTGGALQRLRPPQPMQRPGHTQRPRPQLLRLAGLTGQARQVRLVRLRRLAGQTHRLRPPRLLRLPLLAGRTPRVRRKRAAGGGPPQDRVFPR